MSSFGTGATTTGSSSIVLTAFLGTNGVQAGTDGLVPGPAINQVGYLLGAGGDWTLEVLGGIAIADSSNRVATTQFVQQVVANAALGGNANLGALLDVDLTAGAGLVDDQFLQYNVNTLKWENTTLTLGLISDVNLAGLADGNTIVWDAVAGEWVVGAGGGGGGGATDLDDLNDVAILNPIAGHFLVHNGAGNFVNRLISTADLSDSANIALLNAVQTFSADVTFTADVDLTGAVTDVATQVAGNNSTLVASTAFVQQEITALNLGTASQNDAGDFLASNAGVGDLSNVTLGALAQDQFLVYTGAVNGFENQTISSAILTDSANIALLNANQTFTGTIEATTQNANDNSTKVATTEYADRQVSDSITALNLGTASQNDTGDFLASNAGINDLSDVSTAGVVNGNVLSYNNGSWAPTAPAVTYTDEEARNASGTALANGVHTGISFVNDDANDRINATVSLGGFSVDALSDVDTTTNAPAVGEVLKWDGANFVPSADTGKTQEEIEDIVGAMVSGNTETGISVTYSDNAGGAGKIDFVVDDTVVDLLATNQTITGNKTYTGAVDLTGATATASTQVLGNNTTSLATTAFVQNEITDLDLANTYQGLNARLTDISGLAPTDNNFIVGDGNNFTLEAPTDVITSLGMGVAQNDLLIGSGANTFTTIATTAGSRSFLASNAGLDDLADVTLGGVALAEGQVLRVSNDNTTLINAVLSFGDLSGTGNVVQTDAGATFGAFAYDFTGATSVSVPAPTQNTHASTKLYVDTQVATAQPLEATLTGLANLAPVDGDLIIATGNDTFGVVNISANVETFLGSTGSVGALSDVALDGNQAGNANHFLVSDGNGGFVNQTISTANLSNSANLVVNDANTTFGAVAIDATLATLSVKAPVQDAHVATKKYVDDSIVDAGGVTKLDNLSDVAINQAGRADAQILVLTFSDDADDTNDEFKNVSLSGDVTITNAGVASISNGAVDTLQLANDAVTTDKILNGNVTNAKLANTDVTIGSTAISLGGASTTLSGMTGIDFTNANASIGANMTIQPGGASTELTLGGPGSLVYVSGSLVVLSDLVVQGTTTTINTQNVDVADQVISLNNGVAGANASDIGFFLDRGTSDPAMMFWDEGDDAFKVATHTGVIDSTTSDFSGVAGLTLATLEAKTQAQGDNTTKVATTAYVQTEIGNLASNLDDLTDVTIGLDGGNGVALANGQLLKYDGNVFRNTTLSLDNLSDVTTGVALDGQVLRNNGAGQYVNTKLAHTDLSDHGDYAPLASPNLTGNPTVPTQVAGNNTTRIASTAFVTTAVANFGNTLGTASALDQGDLLLSANNLNDLANVATARTNLGLGSASLVDAGTGAGEVLLLAQANTLPALSGANLTALGSVGLHSDVNVTGAGLATGQTLRYNAVTSEFENTKLASTDLSDTADVVRISANQTLTGATRATTQPANDSSTLLATTAFVQQEIGNASVGDLTDVALANVQAGDVLKWDGADFVNTSLSSNDISDAGSSITRDAGTGAGEVLLLTDANKLPALDGTNLTGVVMEANNLSDLADAGTARTNLGLGTASTLDQGDVLLSANNLNDLANAGTARTNLGLTSTATTAITALLQVANALSEIANAGTQANARTNLGLGTAATQAVTSLLQVANNLSEIANAGAGAQATARTNLGLGSASVENAGTGANEVLKLDANAEMPSIDKLNDVTLTNLANNEVLKSNNGVFENVAFTSTNLNDTADLVRQADIGTSASQDVGVANGNVVQLGANGLPAVSGVNLTALGSIGTHSDVDLTGVADGDTLVWNAITSSFEPDAPNGGIGITLEQARDVAGVALEDGVHTGATTITFTNDDANDRINLDLEIETSNLTDISANAPTEGQILKYNNANSVYEPVTLEGTTAGKVPVLSSPTLENSGVTAELVVYGRIIETIDYGSVAEAFDPNNDWALDFNGTGFNDAVTYANEDYGVLIG